MNDDQIDSSKAPDPVLAVLLNAEKFDRFAFEQWLELQPKALQKAARQCPPSRVYELKSPPGRLCFIHGFGKDGHLVLRGIGDPDQANVHAMPDEVRDVTRDLRKQRGLSD